MKTVTIIIFIVVVEIAAMLWLSGCASNSVVANVATTAAAPDLNPAHASITPVLAPTALARIPSAEIIPQPFFERVISWSYETAMLPLVAFDVETTADLSQPWQLLATVTNLEFTNWTSAPIQYYRVGTHWITNSPL
jgi:hypothetical protein